MTLVSQLQIWKFYLLVVSTFASCSTSKALVTTSVALVTSNFLLLPHLFLVASAAGGEAGGGAGPRGGGWTALASEATGSGFGEGQAGDVVPWMFFSSCQ